MRDDHVSQAHQRAIFKSNKICQTFQVCKSRNRFSLSLSLSLSLSFSFSLSLSLSLSLSSSFVHFFLLLTFFLKNKTKKISFHQSKFINLLHSLGTNGACVHYVMVSKIQRKPFWLAAKLYPQNVWTGCQFDVKYDIFAQAQSILRLQLPEQVQESSKFV